MAIAQAAIGNTDTVVLTVPASTSYTIMVCNHAGFNSAGTNDTSFDLHFVKSGQAKSNTNMVVKEMPVAGGDTFTLDTEKVVLEAGDKVTVLSQAPLNLSITVSYLEV
jgi:FlaG/FlaF family flagellin (archaellin)